MNKLHTLLLLFVVMLLCACIAPNREDYSPEDEVDDSGAVPHLGDDDDDAPVSSDDDDDHGDDDDGDDDDDTGSDLADCSTADQAWTSCSEAAGETTTAPFCGMVAAGVMGADDDWACVASVLDDWDCANGLPENFEVFEECFDLEP